MQKIFQRAPKNSSEKFYARNILPSEKLVGK